MTRQLRVGIVGIGNNASAVVQGVYRYACPDGSRAAAERREGIRFPTLCGYAISDVKFTAAFDVDIRKIGLDLGQAIFQQPNCYPCTSKNTFTTGVIVRAAPSLDGVPDFLSEMIRVSPESKAGTQEGFFSSCVDILRETQTNILINFLPSGSNEATNFFGRVAAASGAAFINCTPTPGVHNSELVALFERSKSVILGDDLESQFGSSLLHRTILNALQERGLEILHSYQVNLGGNSDFKNLTHRPDAKKRSKMKAISTIGAADRVDIVPSGGFVRGLGDNKVGYIVVEGRGWLNMPISVDIKLKVQDSSNAAGVTIDLVRLAAGAMDRGLVGPVSFSYYFKNPLGDKLNTPEALEQVRQFDGCASSGPR